MDYIYLGVITSTHGIKGEVKIKSNFSNKELVFKKGFPLYIGEEKEKKIINTYRVHKNLDMVTFDGILDINLVLKYKGCKVYINRADINLNKDEYLIEDLIGYTIISDGKNLGIIKDIYDNKAGILLYVEYDKNYYIPFNKEFIQKVDVLKKEVIVIRGGELYEI